MIYFGFVFATLASVYLITSLQAYSGFWPFFRRHPQSLREKDTNEGVLARKMIPVGLSAIAAIVLTGATGVSEFFLGFGVAFAWGGVRVRSLERDGKSRALPGFYLYLPETLQQAFATRPMLAFDLWTLGTTVSVAIIFLLSSI